MGQAVESELPLQAPDRPIQSGIVPPDLSPGVTVSITTRAERFGEIFRLIGEVRAAEGLLMHAQSEGRTELDARYGVSAKRVLGGAAERAQDKERRIMNIFAQASGLNGLLESQEDPVRAKAITRQQYKNFTERYGLSQHDKGIRDRKTRQIRVAAGIIDGTRYAKSGRLKPKHTAA